MHYYTLACLLCDEENVATLNYSKLEDPCITNFEFGTRWRRELLKLKSCKSCD